MPMLDLPPEAVARLTFVKDFSELTHSMDELIAKIGHFLANGGMSSHPGLTEYCENLGSPGESASVRILNALESRISYRRPPGSVRWRTLQEFAVANAKHSKFFALWLAGAVLSSLGIKTGPRFPPRNSYVNRRAKQPPTPISEIRKQMSHLIEEAVLTNIKVERLSHNLFLFEARR